jgi:hypothetical protein
MVDVRIETLSTDRAETVFPFLQKLLHYIIWRRAVVLGSIEQFAPRVSVRLMISRRFWRSPACD